MLESYVEDSNGGWWDCGFVVFFGLGIVYCLHNLAKLYVFSHFYNNVYFWRLVLQFCWAFLDGLV